MNTAATILAGAYDYRLVAPSVVIAISASYAALDLAGRVPAARGWTRGVWLGGGAVQYTLLKHEAESRRNLYDGLSQKLKEAGVLASLRSSNIVVMDPARPSDRPARPILLLNLGLGLVGGLLRGVVGAVVAENLDETISSPEQAEEVSLVSSLGFVPRWKRLLAAKKPSKSNELLAPGAGVLILGQPHSQAAEAYRGHAHRSCSRCAPQNAMSCW